MPALTGITGDGGTVSGSSSSSGSISEFSSASALTLSAGDCSFASSSAFGDSVEKSGGGVTLDMGCHAIEFFRWILDKPAALGVYADMGTYSGQCDGVVH